MKLIFTVILKISFLYTSFAFSHGEDKPGPNGGYIKMPGAFHTELLLEGSESLKIFLLDMNWKNPTTQNSEVAIKLNNFKKSESLKCEKQVSNFVCTLPKNVNLNSGQIEVQATREGQKGNLAVYKLPLQLQKKLEKENPHANHH